MHRTVFACIMKYSHKAAEYFHSMLMTSFIFRSTELELLYPDLKEYIADMNVMMSLIINGPV